MSMLSIWFPVSEAYGHDADLKFPGAHMAVPDILRFFRRFYRKGRYFRKTTFPFLYKYRILASFCAF